MLRSVYPLGLALLGIVACSHVEGHALDASTTAAILPAGQCRFDPYLEETCHRDTPRFAVTVSERDAAAATRAIAAHRDLPAGYPFAVSSADLGLGGDRSAIVVVTGLFASEAAAKTMRDALGTGWVRPLATPEAVTRGNLCLGDASYDDCMRKHIVAVQMAVSAPAYAEADVQRVTDLLDQGTWEPFPKAVAHTAALISVAKPVCTVGAGTVHATNEHDLYGFRRRFAPVTCVDGTHAWVDWRATRLESTVGLDGTIDQVILVECDTPKIEHRSAFAPAPLEPTNLSAASCD